MRCVLLVLKTRLSRYYLGHLHIIQTYVEIWWLRILKDHENPSHCTLSQSAANNYVTDTNILIHYSALFNKNQPDARISQNLFCHKNSTCFGYFLCPSSGVIYCTFGNGMHGLTIKFANSPPCACRDIRWIVHYEFVPTGQSTKFTIWKYWKGCVKKTETTRTFCEQLMDLASRHCTCSHGTVCEGVLATKQITMLEHPAYSPDLDPNDFFYSRR
jgi:hypothetical protein